jgi:hypothetical protein
MLWRCEVRVDAGLRLSREIELDEAVQHVAEVGVGVQGLDRGDERGVAIFLAVRSEDPVLA